MANTFLSSSPLPLHATPTAPLIRFTMSDPTPLIDPVVFPSLKEKIEEETQVKDALTLIVQKLDGVDSYARGLLTRVHATPRKNCEFDGDFAFFLPGFFSSLFF